MTPAATIGKDDGSDTTLAAMLLALDLFGLGGAVVKARDRQDTLIESLRRMLGPGTVCQRVPVRIPADRLLGSLDLTASKARGRAVVEPGLLTRSNGGLLVLPSADLVSSTTAANIASALDEGAIHLARDGIIATMPARFGLIALDASDDQGGGCPESLKDRLAFWLQDRPTRNPPEEPSLKGAEFLAARERMARIEAPQEIIEVLVAVAARLGIKSLRAPVLALKGARAHAALRGGSVITSEDAAVAARLILGPRATRNPDQDDAPSEGEHTEPGPQPQSNGSAPDNSAPAQPALDDTTDIVLAAAKTALPRGLLQGLAERPIRRSKTASPMGSGNKRRSPSHGRRIGCAPGKPHSGARLDLLATIRAAVPWQLLRQREDRTGLPPTAGQGISVDIRPGDFRIMRFEDRTEAVTVFVVDASGSAALNRLAEAKGAIELLLADCYVRRDMVAMIAFRRREAELLLPPTRSLTRARRVLAELSGGGGTPLASGLAVARDVVAGIQSRGQTVLCLVLTDGQANVGANGAAGRGAAEADALQAAAALAQLGPSMIVVDTAVRPRPFTAHLAETLCARYIVLPNADAASLSGVARLALANRPQ